METRGKLVIIGVEHQELRHSLRRLIAGMFDRLIFADDFQSLIDTVESTTPDLLLVELSLPTPGNTNVLRALQRVEIAAPVVAIGDYDEEEAIEEVQSAGGAAYVLRTNLSTHIIPAITGALTKPIQSIN